jgi:hypothetical protein
MNKLRLLLLLVLMAITVVVSNVVPVAAKVNEYEGQHRVAVAGDPSQWG